MADTYKERELEDSVYSAALAAAQQQKPTYAGTFDQQLEDLYRRMENREEFSYDVNADPLYQAHKDRFIQGGKLAMKDTMGQAAALTGGYGSTYGQQVGQQAYDAYLQGLSDVIPELYEMAYKRYSDEGDDLAKQFSMLGSLKDNEYSRFRDELSDWNYQQQLERQQEETDYSRRIAEENTAYSRQQSAYNQLYSLILKTGYMPTEEELAAAGMPQELATRLRTIAILQNGQLGNIDASGNYVAPVVQTPTYSGGGSSGGNPNNNGNGKGSDLKDADLKDYLRYLEASGVSKNNQLYQTIQRQINNGGNNTTPASTTTTTTTTTKKKGNGGR